MSKHLQRDLEYLQRDLLGLAASVEEAIHKAIRALQRREAGPAEQVIAGDAQIDQEENHIEEECLKILALHQPVAVDLRRIAAALKINTDLERMADLAEDIADRALHLARLPVEHAAKIKPVADGPVHWKRANAQHPLQFVNQLQRIFHRPVAFVHEREDRHPALAANFKKFSRLRLDAFGRVNHHHDCVHGGQHTIGVLGKILVAGRVEQIDAISVVIKLQDRRADGNAALLFEFHPVGRRSALVFTGGDGAGELHRAAV